MRNPWLPFFLMATSTHLLTSKLPKQVAAVCFRRTPAGVEFLLVNTDGRKWTFPKGKIEAHLSHSQAASKEALEEAGVVGVIDRKHFHIYLHCKGVSWKDPRVREFAVKAFLLEVQRLGRPQESLRNPTWFCPDSAKRMLAKRREFKYSNELSTAIDEAMKRIQPLRRDVLRLPGGPANRVDSNRPNRVNRGLTTAIAANARVSANRMPQYRA
jgi:8-oxo-dGTP pyrophosphatase MutT (NUDIX family)